jgi:PLP dependent protein
VQLIHGVDSLRLVQEIEKQGAKAGRIIDCLLQVHIAEEETKFGLDDSELEHLLKEIDKTKLTNTRICGLMGMASFTDDTSKVRAEFRSLGQIFNRLRISNPELRTLSMGMSADYQVAIEEGSNLVRIGSLLFGAR